ncbi:MAG: hypothetical protein KME60_32490 [Cyanomargarita calcarea GSE-NOS-MK-12-04C]|jgi:hypothetical protein|uniref:DUF4399 domain-containing protein n=1 Tax=Cyanomargarita calcarea GSE-NOS-MK-12-04C TaxID=2839659 RepID=A0A951QTS7_9CYAN|nr:hypothetical protein [Cyanomargarita calcarea GSE-NOS-MK-12-04C]
MLKKIFLVSSTILCLSLLGKNLVISAVEAQYNHNAKHQHKMMEISSGQPIPSIKLVIHKDSMKGWNLEAKITNFKFAPEPGEGHAHLYINSSWYYLGNLKLGKNEITVSLNTNNHQALAHNGKMIQDTAIVQVLASRENRE